MSIEETIHQRPGDRQPREEKSCVARALAWMHVGCPASSHLFIWVSPANHSCASPRQRSLINILIASVLISSRYVRLCHKHPRFSEAYDHHSSFLSQVKPQLLASIFFLRSSLKDPSPSLGCDVLSRQEGKNNGGTTR